ncbi:MAG: hypothetical protein GY745_23800 [Actinomycetia bacterium]|nr:hypothetical protein [Actinomycetes bacterium]
MPGHDEVCVSCGASMSPTQIWCGSCGNQRDLEVLDLSWDDKRAVIIDRQETVLPFWWPWFLPAVAVVVAFIGILGPLVFPAEVTETDEEPVEVGAGDAQPVGTTIPATTTTTEASSTPPRPTTTMSLAEPVGPLLGELTGLKLLSLGGGSTTALVDLDSGEVDEFDVQLWSALQEVQVVVAGDRLVFASDGDSVSVLPLYDLDAEAVTVDLFDIGQDVITLGPGGSSGQVWVLGWRWEERGPRIATLAAVDVEQGSAVQVFSGALDHRLETVLGPPGLVVNAPDGPLLVNLEGITAWSEGHTLAFGPGVALTLTCDAALICGYSFVDLDTASRTPIDVGTAVSLFVKEGAFSAEGARFAAFDHQSLTMTVLDVTSGQAAVSFPVGTADNVPGRPGWSPDGRFVAWRGDQGVLVGDVRTGEVHPVPAELVGHTYDSWLGALLFLE